MIFVDGGQSLLPLIILFIATLFWMALAVWAMRKRSQAYDLYQQSQQKAAYFEAMFKAAPFGTLLCDRIGGCTLDGNAAMLLGLSEQVKSLPDLCPRDGAGGLTADALSILEQTLNSPSTGLAADQSGAMLNSRDGRVLKLVRARDYLDPDQQDKTLFWLEDHTEACAEAEASEQARMAEKTALKRLRMLIDIAPFPIWLRDRNLDLVLVNQAYVASVEYPSEPAVIAAQIDLVDNALTGSSRESARRALESDDPVVERHFAVIGGERRALSISHHKTQGLIAGFAVDVTDVEDKRAELARVIEGHAETLNALSSPVAIFDPDQKLQFFNSAFSRLFRLSDDWLLDRPDHASLLEAMREKRRLPEQVDFRAWKTGQLGLHHSLTLAEELWHLPDGSTLRMVGQPHPLGGLLLLYEDVTDRLALESNYNALIAVQSETLDNLHEAVAVFGSDGRLKLYNPNYADLWSLDRAMLDHQPHFGEILDATRTLMHDKESWPTLRSRLLNQIQERGSHSGRWHRPDGRVIDYAVVPLPDGQTLATHLDVTDSSLMEQALRERNEALETADRLKSEFVANMSYELRTPLNSIIGFTEMLMSELFGPLKEKQRDYLGYVLTAAGDLRDLIDDILDLAVIEAGEMTLDIKHMEVVDLVENCIAIAREQARKAHISLESKVDPQCGNLEGDPRRLTQALYNLLGNAIKYTPPGGRVQIIVKPYGDDQLEFVISDNGAGISKDDQLKVFKKFNTGSGVQNRKGVGLGLSLVQSFIELHCGTVDLVSTPNKGTTVTCLLPRVQTGDRTAPITHSVP
ncbi:sensor protein DivL [alpha proteobacterium Q-1]|nr:sensor protein DivL [alpha proteobacterium Q-1]